MDIDLLYPFEAIQFVRRGAPPAEAYLPLHRQFVTYLCQVREPTNLNVIDVVSNRIYPWGLGTIIKVQTQVQESVDANIYASTQTHLCNLVRSLHSRTSRISKATDGYLRHRTINKTIVPPRRY